MAQTKLSWGKAVKDNGDFCHHELTIKMMAAPLFRSCCHQLVNSNVRSRRTRQRTDALYIERVMAFTKHVCMMFSASAYESSLDIFALTRR